MAGRSSRPLVDVHAHFLPPWYADEVASSGMDLPDGMPWWPQWSADGHLAMMDTNGIDRALLSLSSPGVHFGDGTRARDLARRVNEFAAQVCRRTPERFSFLASLPLPDVDAALAELSYAHDHLGARGVALLTNAGGQNLHADELEPLWRELSRRQSVVLIHPTSPPGWEETAFGLPRPMIEFLLDTTRAVSGLGWHGVLDRHPDARVIIPHGGAALPLLADRVGLFQSVGRPDVTPLPALLARLWYDTAGTPLPTQLPTLTSLVGHDRLLYGNDFCFTPDFAIPQQMADLDAWWPSTSTASGWREHLARNADAALGSREAPPR